MKLTILAAAIASGCSGPSSEGRASNSVAPSGGQPIIVTPREVEAAHLQQLNKWIAEQDRVKPPAPTVAKPSRFTGGRCVETAGNAYKCTYSYFEGEREQKVTADFVRNSSGSWSIR
jgi:hypothetical protein